MASLQRARRLGHDVTALPSPPGVTAATAQREVDVGAMDPSAHGRYFVDPGDRRRLVGLAAQPAPIPNGLYDTRTDTTPEDADVVVYTPRVRLVSKQEALTNPRSDPLVLEVERFREDLPPDRQASLGLLGKNDCAQFAAALQYIYARQQGPAQQQSVPSPDVDLDEAEPDLEIGDTMRHNYSTGDFHAAPVVAKDAPTLITLEAHAGKNLREPEFHLRNGVAGFVQDNADEEEEDIGQAVTVSREQDLGSEEVQQELTLLFQRFRRISGAEVVPLNDPSSFLPMMLGLTSSPLVKKHALRVVQRIGTTLQRIGWDDQGKGWFGTTRVPKGVGRLRGVLTEPWPASRKLVRLQALAQDRRGVAEPDRSQATTDLYDALAAMDPQNPNLATLSLDLANVDLQL